MGSDVPSQEKSTASQTCDSFISKEEVEKLLMEQIKEKEAEIRQLKAKLEKLQLVPRPPASDEGRQDAASSSHNETSLNGRLLVDGASHQSQSGLIVCDGNQLMPQNNSVEDDQRTVGRGECDPDCSSKTGNHLPPLRNSKEHDQRPEEWCEAGSDSSSKTGNQLPLQQNSHEHDQQTDGRHEPGSESSSKSGNQLLLQRNSNEYDQPTEGRCEPGSDSSSETGNELLLQRNSNEYDQPTEGRCEPGSDGSSETGNELLLQQNSNEGDQNSKGHDQLTDGSREPDASYSSDRNWDREGARPKCSQMPFPVGVDDKRSHNANLNLESQFGEKEPILGSFSTSHIVVESADPADIITSTVLNTKGNSVSSPTVEGDGNEESSLLPMSGEVNSKSTSSRRDYGKANNNSLTASEQGTAKQEEFVRELQRKEQLKGASFKRLLGQSLRIMFMNISHEEFELMKDLAKGKVSDLKLGRIQIPYQYLDGLDGVSEHPRTDIREFFESIKLHDLLEELGVSFREGIAAESPVRSSALSGEVDGGRASGNQEDNSSASFLSFESSAENEREIPASRDTEDYEGLPLESVRTDGKEDTDVSFSSDEAGPSSILSSTSSNSSHSLVLNSAEGAQVTCLRGGSSGSCEETEPSGMFLETGSGFSDGITSGKTSLNTGSFEEEIPQEAHFSDSEDNMTDGGGNNETTVDDMQGTSVESCNGETLSSMSDTRASPAFAESDSGISSSGNSAYLSLLTGHGGPIVGDGNQLTLQHNSMQHDKRTVGRGECDPDCSSKTGNRLPLQRNSNEDDQRNEERREPCSGSSPKTEDQPPPQQNSSEPDQVTEGSRDPDAASSSDRNWEHQSARRKRTQTQGPLDPPLWPSSRRASDGLKRDFLARHSRDRSILQSLYTDDRGLESASEAYSERPSFRAMGASSYDRLGGAFSDVPSGGSVARAGLLGGSFHNESSYSSSTHNTAAPLPSFTGQTHFPSVWNGMSSYGVNTSNPSLLPPNDFANRNRSLTGEQNFSREWHSFLDQNFCGSRLSLQQINTPISPNPRFVYGSTSSDFAAEIHPGYSMYGAQRHVLSNGSWALIDHQWSHNRNLNLGASEQRTAEDASALVERRLRGREEREEFMRELQRKEQMIREEREREGRENDDMGWQEAIPRRKPDLVENVCNAT